MIKKGENINSPIMVWQGKVRRCTVPSGTVWYCKVRKELRMLEYLLPLQGIEFNITELAEEVWVSRVTVARVVKKFAEWGVLKPSRTS